MNLLREQIDLAVSNNGGTLSDYTVLSSNKDPYRLDTPANHNIGKWLGDNFYKVHTSDKRIHLRGLFYKLLGRCNKPDGSKFINTEKNWLWLSEKVAKAARYLGYIPWDMIKDNRNSPPRIFTPEYTEPEWQLKTGEVEIYLPDDFDPKFVISGDVGRQPYRLVVIAEKSGVEDLLLPVCKRRKATLCLPTGEISDQLVYDLLKDADEDGRPLVIFQLGDFDPAGHQMAISTARKVQALVDTQFFNLDVKVHAIGLTLSQCIEWDLPSTPLKEGEKRAGKWMQAFGREQTELDAAVALKPVEFARMMEDHLLEYYDTTLRSRVATLIVELEAEANEGIDISDNDIRERAQEKLDSLEELVEEVNEAMYVDPLDVGVEIPEPIEILEGDYTASHTPLIDTAEDWAEQSLSLKDRKQYR